MPFIGKKRFKRYNEFMEKISILGVKITNLSKEDILAKIKNFLVSDEQHYIVTPNPEIILEADKDEELFYILNSADLALGDGIGLKMAGWLYGKNLQRVTGADLTMDLLEMAETKKIKIGVLLWKKSLLWERGLSPKKEVEKVLQKKYPGLDFCVEEIDREVNAPVSATFVDFKPLIVFNALGFPYQEKFIFHNLKNIPSAKVAIGVGGTFDYLTGSRKRAAKFLRVAGLEWFWRLLIHPQRISRILRAVFVFSAKIFESKFICPFLYRKNVVCLVYKKVGDKYKILLVERQDDPGHWQIPQGGTNRQSLLSAGAKETREELNTDKFISKRVYKNLHRYRFGDWHDKNNQNCTARRAKYNYRGQAQGLFIAEFTGHDEDIKVNYWDHSAWKWVDSEKLIDEVHLVRKRGAQRFLKRFKEFVKQK